MEYSKELIDGIKEVYPDYPKILELAEKGSPILGKYLDDGILNGIPIMTILRSNSLETLKELARLQLKKRELYNMWYDEYSKTQ